MDDSSSKNTAVDKKGSSRVKRQSLMPCYVDRRQTRSCNKPTNNLSSNHAIETTSSMANSDIKNVSHKGENSLSCQKVLTEFFPTKNSPKILKSDKGCPGSSELEIEKQTKTANSIKEERPSQIAAKKKNELNGKEKNPPRECNVKKVPSNVPDGTIKRKRGRHFKNEQSNQSNNTEIDSMQAGSYNLKRKIIGENKACGQSHIEIKKKRGRPSKNEHSSIIAKNTETTISAHTGEERAAPSSSDGDTINDEIIIDKAVRKKRGRSSKNKQSSMSTNTTKTSAPSSSSDGDAISDEIFIGKVFSVQLDEEVSKKQGRRCENEQSSISTNMVETNTATSASKGDPFSNEVEKVPSVQRDQPGQDCRGRASKGKQSPITSHSLESSISTPISNKDVTASNNQMSSDTSFDEKIKKKLPSHCHLDESINPALKTSESVAANTDIAVCKSQSACSIPVNAISQTFSTKECQVVPISDGNSTCDAQVSPSLGGSSDNSSQEELTSDNHYVPSGLPNGQASRGNSEYTAYDQAEKSSLAGSESEEAIVPSVTRKPSNKESKPITPQEAPDVAANAGEEQPCITGLVEAEETENPNKMVEEEKKEQTMLSSDDSKVIVTTPKSASDGNDIEVQPFITASMEAEEKKLHDKMVEQDKKEQSLKMDDWLTMQEAQRFSRLQHLLDKSHIYTQFLLKRIEEQKEQEEKKEKRIAKRQENKVIKKGAKQNQVIRKSRRKNENQDSEELQSVPNNEPALKTKRGRKRKANSKLTDYITEEALVKRQKLSDQKSPVNKSPLIACKPDQCVPTSPQGVSEKKDTVDSGRATKASKGNDDTHPSQPSLVSGGSLRSYQIEGLNWLKVLYENGVNGILADEMGLGKTIQCISLVAYLIEMGVRGPFLVAAPLSTLPNWVSEFQRFTPKIPVVLYHGSKDDRTRLRRKVNKMIAVDQYQTQPVVITSYEICMNDQKFLAHLQWKHLIVDEGHRIKNLNCRLIRELKTYNTANRLLLTGTPLQNNLQELWSLLNFLLPDIFDELSSFQRLFDFDAIGEEESNEKIIAQEREHQVLERLHAILTPFLLRRLKADVELSLPPKKELLVYAPLTVKQTTFYKAALDRSILGIVGSNKIKTEESVELTPSGRPKRKNRVNIDYTMFDTEDLEALSKKLKDLQDARRSDKPVSKFQNQDYEVHVPIMNILMTLRKCCNHPYLLEYPLDPATGQFKVDEELVRSSGKMMLLDQLLTELKSRGHKVLIFSQMTKMLDIIEDYCYYRKYHFCRLDGSVKFEERREQINDFNTHPDVFLFLLSTRAGGLGLNLSAADTVIIFDSDWNPQADLQAQDRCHRIGQTKPILVYRLVTANTVDQKMVERAASKRTLEKLVIHRGKFKGKMENNAISAEELKDLLESSHVDHVVANEAFTLGKDELNSLLDRSDLIAKQRENCNAINNVKNQTDSAHFRVIEDSREP